MTEHLAPNSLAPKIKELGLALPLELDDNMSIARRRGFLWFGTLIIAVGLAWSAVTPIREIAAAPGELVPSGLARVIQHPEGGVIERILVRDGQYVDEGQPIVQFSPVATNSEFASLTARQNSLQQQRRQIEALLSNRSPDTARSLTPEQTRVLESRLAARAQEARTLGARAQQRRAELASLKSEAAHLARILEIQAEQLKMRRQLAETGYTSRKILLETEAQLEQARQNVSLNVGRQDAAQNAIREAESQLAAGEADATKLWSEELAKVSAELSEVSEMLAKQKERVDRLVVRAPVRGLVQQVIPRSTGEVLKPGDPIAQFVPWSGPLVAELKLRPNDIAYIQVGAPAEILINGSDPRREGKLKGTVSLISPTTVHREQGEPYYRALVTLDPVERKLVAGMTVRGEVVTGAKTVLRYVLRPVYDGVDLAFSER